MTYADEIRDDIRNTHGERFVSKGSKDTLLSIQNAMALYNAMTQEERDSILSLRDDYEALSNLTKKVSERLGK